MGDKSLQYCNVFVVGVWHSGLSEGSYWWASCWDRDDKSLALFSVSYKVPWDGIVMVEVVVFSWLFLTFGGVVFVRGCLIIMCTYWWEGFLGFQVSG